MSIQQQIKDLSTGDRIQVLWIDSVITSGELELSEINGAVVSVTSTGRLVKVNDEAITIAQDVMEHCGSVAPSYRGILTIPISAISLLWE